MTTSTANLHNFDPSGVGLDNGNLYGLPYDYDTAGIIVFGLPWEVTVSYHQGTAQGPRRVLEASPQLDLYDRDNPDGWRQGIYMPPIPQHLYDLNVQVREAANRVIQATEEGIAIATQPLLQTDLDNVNHACEQMTGWLYAQSANALEQGKRVGVIGGDHSVPLGYLQALADRHADFGVLHIDAHADLRKAYQGFRYSHASIMFNLLELPQVSRLVQVGIRDLCHDEVALIQRSEGRIVTYYDAVVKENTYQGMPWMQQCEAIVADLPEKVYVSFDTDGLDPKLCPNTGTPVPGGLELEEVFCLLRQVIRSGRQIIGFDLSEVGDGEWDGNVGARAVYKLCCLMGLAKD
ncbi:agmatinase family protein [Nodosilinea sp. LEGE 07298]|uniref:agmatinase family protein n=1 Tax=Nodosilinea sp. LEGE 07298 TaxID=2777970 RepID=UPI001881FA7E|nr:agmatinase family protein [Nodosilinea sp. LEGE 07298]MBE9110868.1 agmatinase family protein [Nodosilinea sp. LEGE 07298]